MRLVRSVLLPLALIAVTARCGQSQSQSESLTLSDGTKVRYAVALPDDFDETRTYPTLLAFPPGSQDFGSVTWGMGSHWADQARARLHRGQPGVAKW